MDTNHKKFLLALFNISNGSTSTMVNIHRIEEKIGLEFPEINGIITNLKHQGLLEHSENGDMVAISHEGLRLAEEAEKG